MRAIAMAVIFVGLEMAAKEAPSDCKTAADVYSLVFLLIAVIFAFAGL